MYRNTFYLLCFLRVVLMVVFVHKVMHKFMKRTCDAKTYPFSDPSPVATPNNSYYPYFRFDGFSMQAQEKQWKMVVLENDYVKLTVTPEIGGKIWGAIDKVNNKEFVYTNGVVKFRDVAMRGPWTSGGIEFNFGIIGHAPTCSTPIDYLTKRMWMVVLVVIYFLMSGLRVQSGMSKLIYLRTRLISQRTQLGLISLLLINLITNG